MSFDKILNEFNYKRSKAIIDHFSHPFFHNKNILDLGCYLGDVAGSLFRLGANLTCVDARQEHLKIVSKKFPGIKTIKADLDKEFFFGDFDIIMSLDTVCYLKNFDAHIRNMCAHANYVILETTVCDSHDPNTSIVLPETKEKPNGSFNGFSSRPSGPMIERIFADCGFEFKRVELSSLNLGKISYDWKITNSNACDIHKRRLWIAKKSNAQAYVQPPPPQISPAILRNWVPSNPVPTPVAHVNVPVPKVAKIKTADKKFVIVIPSYNNSQWCEKNITSALTQNYPKFRVIFTDDCSSDDTFEKVSNVVSSLNAGNKCKLVKNTERKGALENLYDMIHSCDDDEIILTLDGDDWLSHDQVLNKLNEVYSDDVWITYGQYQNSTDGGRGVAQPYPHHIIENLAFRQHVWSASHLRTFYTWLFKKIKKEDLMIDGKFLAMTWDLGMMFPMLEMAKHHSRYINDILYIYNLSNPINDHKVNVQLQQSLDRHMRAMPKYSPVEKPNFRPKVGLLLIATGQYDRFVQDIISSADKHFLNDCDVSYYIFTDKDINPATNRKVVRIQVEHQPFPYATMNRFRFINENKDKLIKEDYIYYCDVDSLFANNISKEEIFGNIVAVQHCGYTNRVGPYETNPQSTSYIEPNKYKFYAGGGFSGGKAVQYLHLAQWCYENLKKDVDNGIIPIWHDESIINKYFVEYPPDVVLSPSFHYPQGNINFYKQLWRTDFTQKIILLEKQHAQIRS